MWVVNINKWVLVFSFLFSSSSFAQNNQEDVNSMESLDKRNNIAFEYQGTEELFPVVVIDSGVDYSHKDLGPYLHRNQETSPLQIGTYEIANDTFGWDFNENDNKSFDNNYHYEPQFTPLPEYKKSSGMLENILSIGSSILQNSLEFLKTVLFMGAPGHGSHVSGIILSHCEGACSIVPLKIFGKEEQSLKSLSAAIEYANQRGYKLVNMSLTIDLKYLEESSPDEADINEIVEKMTNYSHILFVVAAGNEGTHLTKDQRRLYPAMLNLPNVITVGAVDDSGLLAEFSNYDPLYVDIYAPGVEILSTWNDGGYKEISGTSMSTPLVVGKIAKLWAQEPHLKVDEIRTLFMNELSLSTIQYKLEPSTEEYVIKFE